MPVSYGRSKSVLNTIPAWRLGPANDTLPEAEVCPRRGALPGVFLDSSSLFSSSLCNSYIFSPPHPTPSVCVCVCVRSCSSFPSRQKFIVPGDIPQPVAPQDPVYDNLAQAEQPAQPALVLRLPTLGVGRTGLGWWSAGETRGHDHACISSPRTVSAIQQLCAFTSCFSLLFQLRCRHVERKHELSLCAVCSGVAMGRTTPSGVSRAGSLT